MILHDFRCPKCGLFERMVDWQTEEVAHECGEKASRVFLPARTHKAQAFEPVLVYRDRSGHLRFPGRTGNRAPKGYEAVYLRTTQEVRSLEKQMNQSERRRYMESKERESAFFDPILKQARSDLRQKMQQFSPAGREFAQLAMRENDAKPSVDTRFDPGFHLEAFSNDSSNREPWNDRDARGSRK